MRDGQWSDELEDQWAERENYALPQVRRLLAGDRSPEARDAVKVLAALHYVRSYAFEIMLTRIIEAEGLDAPVRLATDTEVVRVFTESYGRDPESGEIATLVGDRWIEFTETRVFLLEQMAEGFNKTLDILRPLNVELIWPRRPRQVQFVFADTPLVHYDNRGRVTALGGVALGDADRIFLPLGPGLLAVFTSGLFADGAIDNDRVQSLNRKSWSAAVRFVGAHPEANVGRSTGTEWGIRPAN